MALDPQAVQRLRFEASKVFTPAIPINGQALFAGRTHEVTQVIDSINQPGQHAIIFGERGVGKSSLANVLAPWLESLGSRVVAPRVVCDGADRFSTVWHKVFMGISMPGQTQRAGFLVSGASELAAVDKIPDEFTPDDVRRLLASFGSQAVLIVIVDEFDRIPGNDSRQLFADTIKALSDYAVPATVVLVGVADTVNQLIEEHQSISRALVQVHMQRMSAKELSEIIELGLARLEMTIEPGALQHVSLLSQGLPHYTHLLGLHASRLALAQGETLVRMAHVRDAIREAVTGAQQTIRSAYAGAISSPRKDNLYSDVLLACALAEKDEFGFFRAAGVRMPLNNITKKTYDIPNFSQHLTNFCDGARGPVLERRGTKHQFRFRFVDPLMQPFVVMRGLEAGKITVETLAR
jgi:Cdc6-like AAA superfamily ATPase